MTHKLSSDLCGETLIERYLVLKKIGVGGFATVYRARDTRLGCDMAIKVLHPEHTRNIADRERFRNEAKIAGVINDDYFVKVTDFFQDREHFCFVMEHLDGLTLREELQRMPGKIMPWPRAFKLARQMCAGLTVAHSRGLIHRDIKPENIFIKRSGVGGDQIKLLDLGVAKILEDHNWSGLYKNLSNTGDIIGSPCYIAPEQVRGERALDVRVDIYALGIVLYEMVAGKVPFKGQTAFETMEHHVRSEPKRPTIFVPELTMPRQVEDLILRALCKRPQDRYRNAMEMDTAIRNELDNRSEQRRVRSVQFIQVASEFAWGGAPPPGSHTSSATLADDEEPTTARKGNAGSDSPSSEELVWAAARVAGPDTPTPAWRPGRARPRQPGDTDVTPAPVSPRGVPPKAQGVPTSPDISLEPPAAPEPPVAVLQVRPLRIRTMVMLSAFTAASLLATCSVSIVLAKALDSRGMGPPLPDGVERWPEPAEPPSEPPPTEPPPPDADELDEPVDAVIVESAFESTKKLVGSVTGETPVAPKPRPRVVSMRSIAMRAAAKVKRECKISKFSGTERATFSIQFLLDLNSGEVSQYLQPGPVPILADGACVTRIVRAEVPSFKGAVDLRANFIYAYPVVK